MSFLVRMQSKVYTVSNGKWLEVTNDVENINNIAQEEYELYGMDNLENLPMSILNQEDEFEVLTWSDAHETVEKTAQGVEQAIDEGKLFSTTIDDFSVITGVTVS